MSSRDVNASNPDEVIATGFGVALRRAVSRGDITEAQGQTLIDEAMQVSLAIDEAARKNGEGTLSFNLGKGPLLNTEPRDEAQEEVNATRN